MDNLVMNNKVVVHSTGFNKKKLKDSSMNLQFYANAVTENTNKAVDEYISDKAVMLEKEEAIGNMAKSKLGKNPTSRINALYNTSKITLLNDIIYEMFSKALPLDGYFIQEEEKRLRAYLEHFITEKGGYNILSTGIKESNSQLLKKIKILCETVSNDVCKRKIGISKEEDNLDMICFDLSDDEIDGLNKGKEELDMDDISELVKQKVLTVVQDEKQRSKINDELIKDIEAELAENKDIETDEDVKEAFNKILVKQDKTERTTLFEALMQNTYKEILEYNAYANMNRKRKDQVSSYNVNMTNSDAEKDEYKEYTIDDIEKDEYDEGIDNVVMSLDTTNAPNTDEELEDFKNHLEMDPNVINMDLILAESITKYTLIELFNTLKLDTLTYTKSKNLINSLLK